MPILKGEAEIAIKRALNTATLERAGKLPGGGINEGEAYFTDRGVVFIKQNRKPQAREIFDCEYESLEAIAATNTVRVPQPLAVVENPFGGSFFVLEYIDMKTLNQYSQELGQQIARLHLHNSELAKQKTKAFVGKEENVNYVEEFGFHVKTRCGYTLSENEWCCDWPTFFARNRLNCQFKLIEENYADAEARELWSQLHLKIPKFFESVDIQPALLHGDLWRGNVAETNTQPIIFDPSSFYGHREFDMVTAVMCGRGLGQAFCNAYYDIIPRAVGCRNRNQLYKLFHHLKNWNDFGEDKHKSKAISIMKTLLK